MIRRCAAFAAVLLALVSPRPAAAEIPVALANADGWAAQPPGKDRDRILQRWSAHATLPELMYVLRRGPEELGATEAVLIEQALQRAGAERSALRDRLHLRLAMLDSERTRKRLGPLADALRRVRLAERASVFRVGLLAPSAGSYADYAMAVRAGLETGLEPSGTALPVELRVWDTGEDDPARTVAALDSAARGSGVLVGELLSVPTLLIAASTRVWGTPLVSPTATDETIGTLGPRVYQIGPSGYERGERLARTLPLAGRRVGVLTSAAAFAPFAGGFADAATAAGAEIVTRATYATGATTFRGEVRELVAKKVEALFWDGEPREAAALLKLLSRERASMRICGGQALAPEQHHAETHFLLEGVQYVGDEWSLPAALRDELERASIERTGEPAGPMFVRGWIAGHAIRAALDAGALCPEEIAAELDRRRLTGEFLGTHGFLSAGVPGLELPVYTISRGKAVAAGP